MIDLPILFAFQAGIITTISPCAFPLLPAYISYHLGAAEEGFEQTSALKRGTRAMVLGLIATMGFVTISGSVGFIVTMGGRLIVREVAPQVAMVLGLGLLGLGFYLLVTGKPFTLPFKFNAGPARRGYWPVYLFGIAYGVAAIGCTLPLFLLVIVNALTVAGVAGAMLQFGVYASGMGLVLISVTVGAALFRGAVARGLRYAVPYVEWLSTALVIQAGGYIVVYWVSRQGIDALKYLLTTGPLLLAVTLAITLVRWKVTGHVMAVEG